jgi:hypothetical protein
LPDSLFLLSFHVKHLKCAPVHIIDGFQEGAPSLKYFSAFCVSLCDIHWISA